MLDIILHDKSLWREHLLPLASTRSVADLRVGILTIAEKWQILWKKNVSYHTASHLQIKYPIPSTSNDYLIVRANLCPSKELVKALSELPLQSVLKSNGQWLAYRTTEWIEEPLLDRFSSIAYENDFTIINFLEDIYLKNAQEIVSDFKLLTDDCVSEQLDNSNTLLGDDLFVGKNVEAFCCIFNTMNGPIYIGDGAVIEEGSVVRGPVCIGAYSRVKMGSKLYPNVTLGPGCTIAGEVNNAVLWGNSSKGHEGYLGCAVLGEWCNIGAGSSNSNLQNNWSPVKVYDYKEDNYRITSHLKVGTFIGDFAMLGINSSITTGSVIGVGAQIAISNIIPKFVPDFIWFTDKRVEPYVWSDFEMMLKRRMIGQGDDIDFQILKSVYEHNELKRKKFIKQNNY